MDKAKAYRRIIKKQRNGTKKLLPRAIPTPSFSSASCTNLAKAYDRITQRLANGTKRLLSKEMLSHSFA